MNNWKKAKGKVIAVRVSDDIYVTLSNMAEKKGLKVSEFVKDVLYRGAEKSSTNVTLPPIYDKTKSKVGEVVRIPKGRGFVVTTVKDVDAEGNIIPDV